MSKDYRYQREEWDSVEDESFPSKRSAKRHAAAETNCLTSALPPSPTNQENQRVTL